MSDVKKTVEWEMKVQGARELSEGIEEGTQKIISGLQRAQSEWAMVGTTMTKVGGILTAAFVVPFATLSMTAINTAADFEYSMSAVKAVSQATGEAFEDLTQKAMHLGATTKFTATQAAEGMTMLGRAGWEAHDILEAMPALLSLSAAGMVDLARAADIISDVMMAFGEAADQATRYADMFASAAANANTTIEGLGNAMAYAAPAAATMGVAIEQAIASIALFADAGIKGTRAGTTMDAMMRELRNKVQDGALDFEYFSVAVYDAEGAMRDFYDIMEEVFSNMEGLTQQQRDHAAGLIFSTRALRGFNVLQTTGIERMRQMETTLRQSAGAAEEMSTIMMDNLRGAMIELSSASDGLRISFGELLLPTATKVVKAFTEFVRTLTAIPTPVKSAMLVFGGLVSVKILLVTLMGAIIALTQKYQRAQVQLNAQLAKAQLAYGRLSQRIAIFTANKIGSMVALRATLIGLRGDLLDFGRVVVTKVQGAFTAMYSRAIPALIVGLGKLKGAFIALNVAMGPIGWAIAGVMAAIIGLSTYLRQELTKDIYDFSNVASEQTSQTLGYFIEMSDGIDNQLRVMRHNSSLITEEMVNEMSDNFSSMANAIINELQRAQEEGSDALRRLYAFSQTLSPTDFQRLEFGLHQMVGEQIEEIRKIESEIKAIYAEIASQSNRATEQQIRDLERLSERMRYYLVDALAENLGEAQAIRHQMERDQRARNAQQAAQAAQAAHEEYDVLLKELEDFYIEMMRLADTFEKHGDFAFADQIRTETRTAYYRARMEAASGQADLIADLQRFSGMYVGEINWMTGEFRTTWDQLWEYATRGPAMAFFVLKDLLGPVADLRKEARELAKEMGIAEDEIEDFVSRMVSLTEELNSLQEEFGLTAEAVDQINDALSIASLEEFKAEVLRIGEAFNLSGQDLENFLESVMEIRRAFSDIDVDFSDGIRRGLQNATGHLDNFKDRLKETHEMMKESFETNLEKELEALERNQQRKLDSLRNTHEEQLRMFDQRMDHELRRLDERHMRELAIYDERIDAILRAQRADDQTVRQMDRQRQIEEQRHRISRAVRRGYFDDEKRERQALADMLERFRLEDRQDARRSQIDKIRDERDAHAERLRLEREQAVERLDAQKDALREKQNAEEEALQESLDKQLEAFMKEKELQEEHLERTIEFQKNHYSQRMTAQIDFQNESLNEYEKYLDKMEELEDASEVLNKINGASDSQKTLLERLFRASTQEAPIQQARATALAEEPLGGIASIHNEFNIESMIVRDDQDIERIAEELHRYQEARSMGVRS